MFVGYQFAEYVKVAATPASTRTGFSVVRFTSMTRRQAWADLDVEMMRNDPPWAPFANGTELDFISKSFGCYLFDRAEHILHSGHDSHGA